MKLVEGFRICLLLVVFTLLCPSMPSGYCNVVFRDDFDGTELDKSKWDVFVDKNGEFHEPYVADGLLHSQGYHTRIDSIPTFAAPETGQSVIASASIRLSGIIQKFGFAPNPNERVDNPYEEWDGPITGYYFDTLDVEVQENYVWALAGFQPAFGDQENIFKAKIHVPWYEFHEFAIERTPSEVIYLIDDLEVARVTHAFGNALPVGVWNDRSDGMMLTDWVEVTFVPEPATILLLGLGGLALRRKRRAK